MLNTKIILFLFLLTRAFTSAAQPFYFKHYQVENGLSYNSVFCSLQDKQGFMWFGTRDGLNRFDGYTFKVFRNKPADTTTLGSNFVFSLFQADDKVLWVGTSKGLFQYHPSTESFTLFKAVPANGIRDVKTDADGNLWVVSGTQLIQHNLKTSKSVTYPATVISRLTSVCIKRDNTVWASSNAGCIYWYDRQKDTFFKTSVFTHSPIVSSHRVEKIVETRDGNLLVATSNQGIKLFNTTTKTYSDILTYNADKTEIYARDFLRGAGDDYWIATESGLYVYNLASGHYTNLRKSYTDEYSISDNAVYTLCKDSEGGIWAGTYFGGVNYYSAQALSFQKYYPEGIKASLHGNVVREMAKDDEGHLWIGTEDAGLNKLNLKTGEFTWFTPTGKAGSVAYTNIHGLLASGNKLWIGTYEHGLDVMDIPTGNIIKHYSAGPGANDLKSNFIVTFCQTRSGEIYIATNYGLYKYNRTKDNFSPVKQVPQLAFVYSIIEDAHGTIWATTLGEGVYYFNESSGHSGNIRANDKNGLGSNNVNSVYEGRNGELWFATEGGGVTKFSPQKNIFTHFTTVTGLPSNFVFKVIEDDDQNIWISTSKGLVLYQPAQKTFKTFSKANGLLSDQFNYNSAYKEDGGRLYFGSVKGLVSFQPTTTEATANAVPVYITNFQVNNKDGIDETWPFLHSIYTKNITLSHNESTFSLDFAALSFTSPEMTVYKYKMQDLDKDWTTLPTNRRVYFTQLSPGSYRFIVKASVDGIHWKGNETTLGIRIKPPIWASVWAYALYVLLAIATIYLLVRNYHRRTAEKTRRNMELLEHEKEKELYQAKINFFTNVAHEIRTPLTLIRAPMERLIKKANHPADVSGHLELMERNTKRLLELTSQLLDFRKAEVSSYQLNFVRTDFSKLVADAFASFRLLADQDGLQSSLQLPPQPLIAFVDVDAVQKITNNLFDNAVKYAAAVLTAELKVDETKGLLHLLVRNDGDLIPSGMAEKIFEPFYRMKEAEIRTGSGIGLALARSLAELHGGILVALISGSMNEFQLTLPLRQQF